MDLVKLANDLSIRARSQFSSAAFPRSSISVFDVRWIFTFPISRYYVPITKQNEKKNELCRIGFDSCVWGPPQRGKKDGNRRRAFIKNINETTRMKKENATDKKSKKSPFSFTFYMLLMIHRHRFGQKKRREAKKNAIQFIFGERHKHYTRHRSMALAAQPKTKTQKKHRSLIFFFYREKVRFFSFHGASRFRVDRKQWR